MDTLDYITVLVAVVVGLIIGNQAVSLHRLLRDDLREATLGQRGRHAPDPSLVRLGLALARSALGIVLRCPRVVSAFRLKRDIRYCREVALVLESGLPELGGRSVKLYRINKLTRPGGAVVKKKDVLAASDGEAVQRAADSEDCPICDVLRDGQTVGSVL